MAGDVTVDFLEALQAQRLALDSVLMSQGKFSEEGIY